MEEVMAKTTKHIHQYRSGKLGKQKIWKCKLIGCTHYLLHQFMENKLCICNKCGQPFIIAKRHLRNEHPRCDNCVVHKVKPEIKNIQQFLEEKGLE